MLIGIELLDTLRQNETTDEKTLAKKCGYATVQKNGSEKILFPDKVTTTLAIYGRSCYNTLAKMTIKSILNNRIKTLKYI